MDVFCLSNDRLLAIYAEVRGRDYLQREKSFAAGAGAIIDEAIPLLRWWLLLSDTAFFKFLSLSGWTEEAGDRVYQEIKGLRQKLGVAEPCISINDKLIQASLPKKPAKPPIKALFTASRRRGENRAKLYLANLKAWFHVEEETPIGEAERAITRKLGQGFRAGLHHCIPLILTVLEKPEVLPQTLRLMFASKYLADHRGRAVAPVLLKLGDQLRLDLVPLEKIPDSFEKYYSLYSMKQRRYEDYHPAHPAPTADVTASIV